ncbi:hypothetical protein LCGC14_1626360 [marine sediment metagenome]|uniref:Uncharacterized protein n=1 Tax=marine sediment metagenome TaxID=412755 RepID=A0A0F9IQY1_9ZZZZ
MDKKWFEPGTIKDANTILEVKNIASDHDRLIRVKNYFEHHQSDMNEITTLIKRRLQNFV